MQAVVIADKMQLANRQVSHLLARSQRTIDPPSNCRKFDCLSHMNYSLPSQQSLTQLRHTVGLHQLVARLHVSEQVCPVEFDRSSKCYDFMNIAREHNEEEKCIVT